MLKGELIARGAEVTQLTGRTPTMSGLIRLIVRKHFRVTDREPGTSTRESQERELWELGATDGSFPRNPFDVE